MPFMTIRTSSKVKRSKFKVIRRLKAVAENQPCLWNFGSHVLRTPNLVYLLSMMTPCTSPICAVTLKVKGQGYNVSSSVCCVLVHNSTKTSRKSTKIGKKVVRETGDIAYQFQGQKVKGQGGHLAALGGCSSHHLQGGAYCGGRNTGRTACYAPDPRVGIKR